MFSGNKVNGADRTRMRIKKLRSLNLPVFGNVIDVT
jgi:hypothetical protein